MTEQNINLYPWTYQGLYTARTNESEASEPSEGLCTSHNVLCCKLRDKTLLTY